ncbi:hypothetical protein GOODEAATRI_023411 [Goodea atripinnis]|uniref:Uncharacterized protein n=1 Tax=Goodea atripinnis TaxID=208336 RepID=A0ABV0PR15_9TELE
MTRLDLGPSKLLSNLLLTHFSDKMFYCHPLLEVLSPYTTSLISYLERKFEKLRILGAFGVLGPQAPTLNDAANTAHLQTLTNSSLDRKPQLSTSGFDEWTDIYPCRSQLAAAAQVIPVSSVNCERDHSAINRLSDFIP